MARQEDLRLGISKWKGREKKEQRKKETLHGASLCTSEPKLRCVFPDARRPWDSLTKTTNNMQALRGLHHVTCISGPAQENLDFYAGVLGMRLVKRSVNQDDPGTYHLFYADAEGHPGSDLTFFPWAQMAPSRDGFGLSTELSVAVPPGRLVGWSGRMERYGVPIGAAEVRFGEHVLLLTDLHGLRIALVESASAMQRAFTPWRESPVPESIKSAGWRARE